MGQTYIDTYSYYVFFRFGKLKIQCSMMIRSTPWQPLITVTHKYFTIRSQATLVYYKP